MPMGYRYGVGNISSPAINQFQPQLDFHGDVDSSILSIQDPDVAEAGALIDSSSATASDVAQRDEVGALAETQSGVAAFPVVIAEATGGLADTPTGAASFPVIGSDAGALTDSASASQLSIASIAEVLAGVETSSATASDLAARAEAGNAVDTSDATVISAASIAEAGNLVDSDSATQAANGTVAEVGAIADTTTASASDVADRVEVLNAADDSNGQVTIPIVDADTAEVLDAQDTSSGIRYYDVFASDVLNAFDRGSIVITATVTVDDEAYWLLVAADQAPSVEITELPAFDLVLEELAPTCTVEEEEAE